MSDKLPPMPNKSFLGTVESIDAYNELRSWAEACRAERDALVTALTDAADRMDRARNILAPPPDKSWAMLDTLMIRIALKRIGLPDSSTVEP